MRQSLLNSSTSSVDDAFDERAALWSPQENLLRSSPLISPNGSIRKPTPSAKQGTIKSSVFNLANTILGTGCLACPYACKLLGVGGFVILMLFSALLADYAIKVLFVSVEKLQVERARYPTLGRRTMGSFGEYLSSLVVTLQQCGACIGYMVIIGDVLQPIAALSGWEWTCHRWILQLALLVCVIFPLCLLPTMSSLKYVSFASLILIISCVLGIVANGFLVLDDPSRRNDLLHPNVTHSNSVCKKSDINTTSFYFSETYQDVYHQHLNTTAMDDTMRMFPVHLGNALSALPIISFAFLCHQNTFPIYKELKNASPTKMATVGHYSISICCFVYLMSGIMGYYTFLDNTKSDLLINFSVTGTYFSMVMDIVRTGFGIACVLSYPLMVWEARHNIDVLLFGNRKYQFWRNFGLNLGILSVCGAIGMTVQDLDVVLGFVGSTCSPLMVFVLPALFYLKSDDENKLQWKNWKVLCMLGWGLFLIPACLFCWTLGNFFCTNGAETKTKLCEAFGY